MCGVVKPLRVECGPMHGRLPGQAIKECISTRQYAHP